jgi:predicted lipid-binding transport protein (Tim44 family)
MKTSRWLAAFAAVLIVAPLLAPLSADARVSRGTKTGQAPAPTQTAPTAAPIQRSATPTTQPSPTIAQAAPAAGGGFMSRHPFMSGLMGGMLGAGLFGMMFGNGFGGGPGLFGMMFQLLLIGGIGYFAVRYFRGRTASSGASPYAYAAATPRLMEPQMTRNSAAQLGGGGSAPAAGAIAITTEDYNAFESLLGGVQTAYSAGDLAKLRTLVTPEMLGYFSEQLSGNASRGLENKVEAVKLEQGDLSEAWSEQGLDYATVALRFSLLDYTRRLGDGAIVEGNQQARTEATEIWTFLRSHGGTWILSAIQQAA